MAGLSGAGRVLVAAGIVLVVLGLVLVLAERVPGLGRLPGDFVLRRGGFTLYVPVTTCLLLSALLTLALALLRR
ncbi:MAG TPA: DUF2905 domain-containing protein [Vicinamibacteria bacterium]|nr:DUF2905 domain-containing protein [Vicinamibacteria bacterium]